MDIGKGRIRNINKKLLAGALALTLLTIGFTGCIEADDRNRFDYTTNEQGIYEVSGIVDYSILKEWNFLVIENTTYDVNEYYIAWKWFRLVEDNPSYTEYYNVFDDQVVHNDLEHADTRNILVSENLEDYLYATGNIKANYTVEEVEQILEELKQIYLSENNKQLVKE